MPTATATRRKPLDRKAPSPERCCEALIDTLSELTAILDHMIEESSNGAKIGYRLRGKAVKERRRILNRVARILGVEAGTLERKKGGNDA